jgi:hypothetical protein
MHYSFVFEGLMHFAACVDHSPPSLHPQIGLLRLSAQLCFCLNVEPAVVPLSIQAGYRHDKPLVYNGNPSDSDDIGLSILS